MREVEGRQPGSHQGAGDEDGVEGDADSARASEATCSPHATRYREVFEEPVDPIEGHTYAFLGELSHAVERPRLLSPGEASVLGLAVVVVERLQPGDEAK